ncbi:hypothetical protein BKH42_05415 [Helicobacter sp. 13S00482-2]|nr:hypothetical protein BKH42_05415 [Helicobacter sp. 13S00482-2]
MVLFYITLSLAEQTPLSVVQKPTDSPKDKPIKITVHDGGKFCYAPSFSGGESYIEIVQCWEQGAIASRYDVFQRLSYQIDGVWLCITAPQSVTQGGEGWDYVHLRPCVINDANQRWILKDNAFWTADGKYRLKDYEWYGYISKNSGDNYNHTLDASMKDWMNTIATPGNISVRTLIGWNFPNTKGITRYYLDRNLSSEGSPPLYYNPDNGHIASYDKVSGSLYCMHTQTSVSQDWNWASWEICNDAPMAKDDANFWNLELMSKNGGIIRDYRNNALRVTRYGSNWGVAYTAKRGFLKNDTIHSPTSEFRVDRDLLNWIRYVDGNISRTLQHCPAPGLKTIEGKKRQKRNLPSDFTLNQEWINRLYSIAVSTDGSTPIAGRCGICLLHSYQMLAELQERYPGSPFTTGGYFFNTATGVNPFISFSTRNSLLYHTLIDMTDWFNRPLLPGDNAFYRDMDIVLASSISMLSQYDWTLTHRALARPDIIAALTSLFNAPDGSAWIAVVVRRAPDGSINNHAIPIVRTTQGLVVIPTNTNMSFERFNQLLAPSNDAQSLVSRLTARASGSYSLTGIALFAMRTLYSDSLDREVSNNNCTGEGEDRRGTGVFPSAASVNQCDSGRCGLSE